MTNGGSRRGEEPVQERSAMKEHSPWPVAAMILLCAAAIAFVDYLR
jgi:hypothetical protein